MLTGPGSVLPAHHAALSLPGLPPPPPAGSLEALRAHAHAAASIHSPLLQSSAHGKICILFLRENVSYFRELILNATITLNIF